MTFLPKEKWPGGENGTELCHVYSGTNVVNLLIDAGFAGVQIEIGPLPEQFREISVIGIK